eukprot:scaffold733_cov267-Pinguiococcus_pyrenoidosus.AAC.60
MGVRGPLHLHPGLVLRRDAPREFPQVEDDFFVLVVIYDLFNAYHVWDANYGGLRDFGGQACIGGRIRIRGRPISQCRGRVLQLLVPLERPAAPHARHSGSSFAFLLPLIVEEQSVLRGAGAVSGFILRLDGEDAHIALPEGTPKLANVHDDLFLFLRIFDILRGDQVEDHEASMRGALLCFRLLLGCDRFFFGLRLVHGGLRRFHLVLFVSWMVLPLFRGRPDREIGGKPGGPQCKRGVQSAAPIEP